jgi:hypothetical protein
MGGCRISAAAVHLSSRNVPIACGLQSDSLCKRLTQLGDSSRSRTVHRDRLVTPSPCRFRATDGLDAQSDRLIIRDAAMHRPVRCAIHAEWSALHAARSSRHGARSRATAGALGRNGWYDRPCIRGDSRFPHYADLCRSTPRLVAGTLRANSSSDRVAVLHDRIITSSGRLNA